MAPDSRKFLIGVVASLWLLIAPSSRWIHAADHGAAVVVRSGESALRVGDRIIGWSGSGPRSSDHQLSDPIDWCLFAVERLPRGGHSVTLVRDGRPRVVELQDAMAGLVLRPALDSADREIYRQADNARRDGRGAEAAKGFAALARSLDRKPTRLSAWAHLEAFESQPRQQDLVPSLDAVVEGLDRLSPEARSCLRLELADALDRFGDQDGAIAVLDRGLAELTEHDEHGLMWPMTRARFASRLGRLFRYVGQHQRAKTFLDAAREAQIRLAPASSAIAETWNDLGAVALAGGDIASAERSFRRALDIRRSRRPEDPDVAILLNNLGLAAALGDRIDEAEALHGEALAILERAHPEHVEVAKSLGNLAMLAAHEGDFDGAEQLFRRSLDLKERLRLAPSQLVDDLHNLGLVHMKRGDLASAESFYRRALGSLSGSATDSLEAGIIQSNLGWVAALRGNLESAESSLFRAVDLIERHAPGGMALAHALDLVGQLQLRRGDPAIAESYFVRSELILAEKVPEGTQRARTLRNLGQAAFERGDFERARRYTEGALDLVEETSPKSLDLAIVHSMLGHIAYRSGDESAAMKNARLGLEVSQRLAPNSVVVAHSHLLLGDIALGSAHPSRAERHFRRSLEIANMWHFGAIRARAHLGLARLDRQLGRPREALASYRRAVELEERQRRRLGGGDLSLARYGDSIDILTQEYLDLLMETGHERGAFDASERYRARSFRDLLASRDLVHRQVPERLDRERRRLDAAYDQLLESIMQWDGQTKSQASMEARLAELRHARREIRVRIKASAPTVDALRHAEPLDLEGVRQRLDAGTLLLSFAMGAERVHLFAVRGGPASQPLAETFRPITLRVDPKTLASEISAFRRALDLTRPGTPAPIGKSELDRLGRRLYDQLLASAADLIADSERLLIVTDGILSQVPFGALIPSSGAGTTSPPNRYLVEWKPVSTALSATVLSELRDRRRADADYTSAQELELVGIGAPLLEAGPSGPEQADHGGARTASVVRLSALPPLPGSRDELNAIARYYPPKRTHLLMGEEASEAALRDTIAGGRIVHFATHGLIDARSPLDSALVLSHPGTIAEGGGNGLLQAWEIFEGIDLEARLVVLSACDSGLGQALRGEGLYGIVRAFHFAGASSVVASLWPVADDSTVTLMADFHRHVAAGHDVDEALRRAQVALLRGDAGSAARHPFAWAGFQLYGDWLPASASTISKP